ncbi:Amidase [Quillaja saponaria]|uniref:Amidase n=1 Tax=Quillaja saponaria TaxID=32244 RepID=A0AAD7VJA2_QUISA|nr:Amidase [Quillaja saponaria]
MARASDYGAFMEKLLLQPISSPHPHGLPLNSLTFAIKDINIFWESYGREPLLLVKLSWTNWHTGSSFRIILVFALLN